MNILKKLEKAEGFSHSEKEIAGYILGHKEEVLSMSVQDLSRSTFTSTSSVVRMCRKMGFSD